MQASAARLRLSPLSVLHAVILAGRRRATRAMSAQVAAATAASSLEAMPAAGVGRGAGGMQ